MNTGNTMLKWIALLVLIVGVTGFLLGQAAPGSRPIPAAANVQVPPSGRYQIVINPNVRADTFLLDTDTGKIWLRAEVTDVQDRPNVWKFEERFDNQADFLKWSQGQKFMPSTTK